MRSLRSIGISKHHWIPVNSVSLQLNLLKNIVSKYVKTSDHTIEEMLKSINDRKSFIASEKNKVVSEERKIGIEDLPEHELWTTKYKPTKFHELLTDELTNRNILTWLSSWRKDEVKVKPGARFAGYGNQSKQKGFFTVKNKNDQFKPREYNYPKLISPEDLDFEDKRILIIGGDPGTGKSVLADTVAKH